MSGSLNRARNQMWEQADEQGVIDEGPRWLDAFLIDVDDIGDLLKGVERNAGWKDDADERQWDAMHTQHGQGICKRVREKVEVLERCENAKIQHQREDEPMLAIWINLSRSDSLSDQKIDRRAAEHERQEARVPPCIKEIAGDEQKDVLGPASEPPIDQDDRNQEKKIWRGIKQHCTESGPNLSLPEAQ